MSITYSHILYPPRYECIGEFVFKCPCLMSQSMSNVPKLHTYIYFYWVDLILYFTNALISESIYTQLPNNMRASLKDWLIW